MILAVLLTVAGGAATAYFLFTFLFVGVAIELFEINVILALASVIALVFGIILIGKAKNKKNGVAEPPYIDNKYLSSQITGGIIGIFVLIVYIVLYFLLIGWLYSPDEPNNMWGYLDIIGLGTSAFVFGIWSFCMADVDFSNPIFGKYHPTGRTIKETKKYVSKVYLTNGLERSVGRMISIFAFAYIIMIAAAVFIDEHAFNLLLTSPLLFVGMGGVYSDTTYEDFIAKKSKCEEWKKFVCQNCNTLIPGKSYLGRENRGSSSTQYRDTTTTTTTTTDTTTIGYTTYVDTTVRTDVKVDDYILTTHSYADQYRCPNCKRVHSLSGSYTTRRDL